MKEKKEPYVGPFIGGSQFPITFTPGIPTEDGWYVVKVSNMYRAICVINGIFSGIAPSTILSHAKLPEL